MTSTPLLRIGAGAGRLARAQAEWVADRLSCCTALVWIKDDALHEALRGDRIDAAVHSMEDLPVAEEPGVTLASVPVREDPRDVLVARDGLTLDALPAGARVGVGSPRLVAQLRRRRPDLVFEAVPGRVDAERRRVGDEAFDAVVLALAALRRLGREDIGTEILDPDVCLPAAGQGALGITIRRDDSRAEGGLRPLSNVAAAACTAAERGALEVLGAGCHAPVGALAQVEAGRLRLRVRVTSLDGRAQYEAEGEAPMARSKAVGERVAKMLLAEGAGELVRPA